MKLKGILIGLVGLAILIGVGSRIGSWLGEKEFATATDQLFAELSTQTEPVHPILDQARDLAGLPEAIRFYLNRALSNSSKSVRTVRIRQTGRIKVAEDAGWDDYAADQLVSLAPPGLAWTARVEYLPLVPAMVTTALLGGRGWTESSFWGLIPSLENESYTVSQYLLQRWLAEAVWYPEALVSTKGLEFKEGDSKQNEVAKISASLKIGDLQVRGDFYFFRSSKAPFLFIGEPIDGYSWYCEYSKWKKLGGRQVPTRLTEGMSLGPSRTARLEVTVESIDYR